MKCNLNELESDDSYKKELNRKAAEHYATLTGIDKDIADAKARVRALKRNVMRSQARIYEETLNISSNQHLLRVEIARLLKMQGMVTA